VAAGLRLFLNGWKMLQAKDYANVLALINRATVNGAEVEEVVQLKAKLVQAHKYAAQTESGANAQRANKDYDPADFPMALAKARKD